MAKRIAIIVVIVAAGCGLIVVLSPRLRVEPQNTNTRNTNAPAVECERDSDCLASGCSGTLCLPRDQAGSQYTTCEWQPEYACYAEDSCLCRAGRCQWQGAEAFATCVGQLK